MTEVQRKNLVIAEFMRPKEDSISALKYHESWDWLMPVVAKIMRDEDFWDNEFRENLAEILPYGHIEEAHESVYLFCRDWKATQIKFGSYKEIDVILLLSPAEQEAFDVYQSRDLSVGGFDWGAHKCTKYNHIKNAFLIGTCRTNDQVNDLLNEFDSTFGTSYLKDGNISSKIILKYYN
jgi:hypothetical protein